MSSTSTAPSALPTSKANLLELEIRGRIETNKFHDGNYYTVLTCPSSDPFDQPDLFEVKSPSPLGQQGQIIHFTARLRGRRGKEFSNTDKNTGLVTKFHFYPTTLQFIASL